jgi:hypothetical protein
MWWIYIVVVALIALGIYGFAKLVRFETHSLSRRFVRQLCGYPAQAALESLKVAGAANCVLRKVIRTTFRAVPEGLSRLVLR